MIQLKDLYWKNVGRFVDQQNIDFTKLGSLIQVDGKIIKNGKDTGRSSGSAKTTVFKALDWLFGISDTPTTILQSRLTKETILVGAHIDWDGKQVHIERGKKLSITVDGVETIGSSKVTEELLDQIIGMPRDLFRMILHKRQREGGFFLSLGPSKTHKFFIDCLSLQNEQDKVFQLEKKLSLIEDSATAFQNWIDANKMALHAIETAIAGLGLPPTADIDSGAVQVLKDQYDVAVATHKLVKDAHQKEMADFELTKPKVETAPFDRSEIVRLEGEIKVIQDEISALELAEAARQSDTKSKISVVRVDISKYESAEIVRQSEAKAKIEPLQKQIRDLENGEKNRQAEVLATLSLRKISKANATATVNDGLRGRASAPTVSESLKKVRASICPTCEQGWINDAAKAKESAIVLELQELRKVITAGMEAEKTIAALDIEIAQLVIDARPKPIPGIPTINAQIESLKSEAVARIVPEIDELESQITRLKMDTAPKPIPGGTELRCKIDLKNQDLAKFRIQETNHQTKENQKNQDISSAFDQRRTSLREKHDVSLSSLEQLNQIALSTYEAANGKLASFQESSKRYSESKAKLDSQKAGYGSNIKERQEKLDAVNEEIEVIKEAKKLIKSYISCSFEDALDSIGDTATKLIRSIPNMETATIQFDGLKETQEGKIKEEVTPMLSMDGEVGVPLKSVSGGETSSVDLGIDISVIKFIEERTGKGIDLFILDEPFTGLDTPCIEDAIEMLRNCSVDKRLLIVEHNPVIAQSIENRITVVRDGLTSNIVQQ